MGAKGDKTITTPADAAILVPRDIISRIKDIGETELKVLLCICADKTFDTAELSKRLGINEDSVESALAFWRGTGIIQVNEAAGKDLGSISLTHTYDSQTLNEALTEKKAFKDIKNNIEGLLGKILNKNDLSLLYNLYDFMGLSADYICCVAQYSINRGKANLKYIVQTCLNLYDSGILTYETLEQYFKERQKIESAQSRFISMCGFGGRMLSTKEKTYLTRWFDELDMPYELVVHAYEKMIDTIGKISFPYMGKMIDEWAAKSYTTVAEAEQASTSVKKTKAAKNNKSAFENDSFDVDEVYDILIRKG